MPKKLWSGRFSKDTNPLVEEFTRSVQYGRKLARYDVFGSIAHVRILKKAGYLTASESAKLLKALGRIYAAINNGSFRPDLSVEDIHTDIQNKLEASIGYLALKLHTARSRNDQVAFSTKMYCKAELAKLGADIALLRHSLLGIPDDEINVYNAEQGLIVCQEGLEETASGDETGGEAGSETEGTATPESQP